MPLGCYVNSVGTKRRCPTKSACGEALPPLVDTALADPARLTCCCHTRAAVMSARPVRRPDGGNEVRDLPAFLAWRRRHISATLVVWHLRALGRLYQHQGTAPAASSSFFGSDEGPPANKHKPGIYARGNHGHHRGVSPRSLRTLWHRRRRVERQCPRALPTRLSICRFCVLGFMVLLLTIYAAVLTSKVTKLEERIFQARIWRCFCLRLVCMISCPGHLAP